MTKCISINFARAVYLDFREEGLGVYARAMDRKCSSGSTESSFVSPFPVLFIPLESHDDGARIFTIADQHLDSRILITSGDIIALLFVSEIDLASVSRSVIFLILPHIFLLLSRISSCLSSSSPSSPSFRLVSVAM